MNDYIAAIHTGIWKELRQTGPKTDSYRRNLQKAYVGSAQSILLSASADITETDVFTMVRADILQLKKEITLAIPKTKDSLTKYHLEDLLERIRKTLDAKPSIE